MLIFSLFMLKPPQGGGLIVSSFNSFSECTGKIFSEMDVALEKESVVETKDFPVFQPLGRHLLALKREE